MLGKGGQGEVRRAIDLDSQVNVALKIFHKEKMTLHTVNAAYNEYVVMKSLNH